MLPSSQPCCSVIRGPQPASSLCTSSPPTAPIQAKAPLSTEAALPHCCSLTALFPPVPKFSQLLSGCSKPGLASSSAVGVTGKTRNNGNLFLSKPIRLAGMTVILGSQVLPPNMAWQHQARVPRLLWAHTSRIFSLHSLLTTGIILLWPWWDQAKGWQALMCPSSITTHLLSCLQQIISLPWSSSQVNAAAFSPFLQQILRVCRWQTWHKNWTVLLTGVKGPPTPSYLGDLAIEYKDRFSLNNSIRLAYSCLIIFVHHGSATWLFILCTASR